MTTSLLPAGKRWRCDACGNLTRFDVVTTERLRRFWHQDLSGTGTVDEQESLALDIESVTCRWCGSTDAVTVAEAPGAAASEGD